MFGLYRDILRGTQLARRNQIMWLRYDSYIVAGAMTSLNASLQAAMETAMSFSFTYLVKSIQLLPNPKYGVVDLKSQFAPAEQLRGGTLSPSGLINTLRPVRTRLIPATIGSAATKSPQDEAAAKAKEKEEIAKDTEARQKFGTKPKPTKEETQQKAQAATLRRRG